MKQYTQEEIRRLVPEATEVEQFPDGSWTIEIEGLYLNTGQEAWPRLLLQTRARLEVAAEMFNEIKDELSEGSDPWILANSALAKLRSME